MNIGDLLRFIRTKKNIKQKEMIPDHHDSSTYSRIENNQRTVKINDLEKILLKLNIQTDEFFSYTSLDKEYEKFTSLYYYCATHPENQSTKKQLLSIYFKLEKTTTKNIKELSNFYAIKSFYHNIWQEVKAISKEEIEIIYQELSNVKYFFGFEYKLLSNTITFFSNEQTKILIQKAYPIKDESQRDYVTRKFAYNTLINIISITLHRKEYDLTKKYIDIAKDLDKSNTNYSFRMNLKYLENLTNWIETGEPKYMQQITNFITILEDIGDYDHAKNVKAEVKDLTHHKDINTNASYSVGLIKES